MLMGIGLSLVLLIQDGPTVPQPTEVTAIQVSTVADDIDAGAGGLAIDSNGNLFTADFGFRLDGRGKGGNKIYKVSPVGKTELFSTQMRGASGNRFDKNGNLIQSSIGGNFISRITPEGKSTLVTKEGLRSPVGIAVHPNGELYVCNCGGGNIVKIDAAGKSSELCTSPLLKCPNGITMGPNGELYVCNFSNGDVLKITPDGKATRLVSLPGNNNGHLVYYSGYLFVIGRTANKVFKVTFDGKASVFAGTGRRGKLDGKPTEAMFSLPNSIVVDKKRKLMYLNETSPIQGDPRILGPTRIRKIELSVKPL